LLFGDLMLIFDDGDDDDDKDEGSSVKKSCLESK
jgi:hypothetical protein